MCMCRFQLYGGLLLLCVTWSAAEELHYSVTGAVNRQAARLYTGGEPQRHAVRVLAQQQPDADDVLHPDDNYSSRQPSQLTQHQQTPEFSWHTQQDGTEGAYEHPRMRGKLQHQPPSKLQQAHPQVPGVEHSARQWADAADSRPPHRDPQHKDDLQQDQPPHHGQDESEAALTAHDDSRHAVSQSQEDGAPVLLGAAGQQADESQQRERVQQAGGNKALLPREQTSHTTWASVPTGRKQSDVNPAGKRTRLLPSRKASAA